MSQYSYEYVPVRQSNALGMAGFICSLVGLVLTGGILCPVGLVLSIAALGRQPRGFAIAGVVIGLLGTCGGLLVVLAFGAMILAAMGIAVAAIALSDPQKVELTSDMINLATAIKHYRDENHYLPAGLELVSSDEQVLTDPWGTKYQYVQNDPKDDFDIISAGKDKQFDTPDDVKLSRLGEAWMPPENVYISGDDKGGVVEVEVGGKHITVHGGAEGGRVEIDTGKKVFEAVGDAQGGRITESPSTAPTTALETP